MLCPFKVFRFSSLPVFNLLLLNHSNLIHWRTQGTWTGYVRSCRLGAEVRLWTGRGNGQDGQWRASLLWLSFSEIRSWRRPLDKRPAWGQWGGKVARMWKNSDYLGEKRLSQALEKGCGRRRCIWTERSRLERRVRTGSCEWEDESV